MKKNNIIKNPTIEHRRNSYKSLLEFIDEKHKKPHELLVDLGLLFNNDYPELAKSLFEEALTLRPSSKYIKKKLNQLKEFDKATLLNLPRGEKYSLILLPRISKSNIRSHRFLYKKWVERILNVYNDLNIIVLSDVESDENFPDFLISGLKHSERLDFVFYEKDNIRNKIYGLIKKMEELPFFCLHFETVETQDNFFQRLLYKLSINIGVHCNPVQPICNYNDFSFLGYETRALETRNKFLPVIIDHELPKKKKPTKRKNVIVSAFTSKRISSLFNKDNKLQELIIKFLNQNPDWHWEVICDDSEDDFINKEIFKCKQFKLSPLKIDLYDYFQQCSIYCMFPNMMGGDGTALLAVNAGLPIVAKTTKVGFLKYATHKYVTNNESDFFDFLTQLTKSEKFRNTVSDHQLNYTKMLKSFEFDKKFKDYIDEVKIDNHI